MKISDNADGILLYAKQSGITSFTSLWAAKRAVNTTKIGHTGTLDNFADGLLVVLVNRMRKLTAHITDFDKTYEAIIHFGIQTDTLDTDGAIVAQAPLPTETAFKKAAAKMLGTIEQLPPSYSAIQIGGMRASALTRSGIEPDLKKRPVHIFSLDIIDFTGEFAHIRVRCSKGTYIRSLARDLATDCGSCGYLAALRRTEIGPFLLPDAAGFDFLPYFSIALAVQRLQARKIDGKQPPTMLPEPQKDTICAAIHEFTPELAQLCGFTSIFLIKPALADFLAGKKILKRWFESFPENPSPTQKEQYTVFGERGDTQKLCGLIEKKDGVVSYVFVLQAEKPAANPLKGTRAFHPKDEHA